MPTRATPATIIPVSISLFASLPSHPSGRHEETRKSIPIRRWRRFAPTWALAYSRRTWLARASPHRRADPATEACARRRDARRPPAGGRSHGRTTDPRPHRGRSSRPSLAPRLHPAHGRPRPQRADRGAASRCRRSSGPSREAMGSPRRGGAAAGSSRCSGGRRRPCSTRTSRSAPRTRTARACSTSHSRRSIRKAISSRSSPRRFRRSRTAAWRATARSVTWKLKRGVTWHDGKPFTADDLVFNWEYAADPATAAVTITTYRDIERVEKVDSHTRQARRSRIRTPFWFDAFCGARGMIIPKHLFQAFKGDKSREAPTNLKPVGTGPYRFVDFRPGDLVRGEINPDVPRAESTVLRPVRDERRRRRRVGGPRRAPDRRVRLRLEPAGRGRQC